MRTFVLVVALVWALTGCLSAFHRVDTDKYDGAGASWSSNGRATTASQPTVQQEPEIGNVFVISVHGKNYQAEKKTDGRVYIIQEVR
jgi:hypothetical protein